MSLKKKASAVIAGVLAATLAVGGAYAWTDYSQSARNTFKGTVAADVLLHDDFDGENKDVYVENTGDNAVFVRVKFAEYLQIGNNSVLASPAFIEADEAGNKGLDVDGDGVVDTEYKDVTQAQPDDVATWPVHQFTNAEAENKCANSTHNYFAWNMSGLQKAYLSGVTEASSNGYGGLSEAQFNALTIGAEVSMGDITTKKMLSAADSQIMLLSDWLAADPKPTNACWLLDTDGWAYWSHALAADSATNLLLDEVTRVENSAPYDNWVYNIDVQLQAATQNELDYWYADGVAEVASADNSVATVTTNGLAFIKERAGSAITSADGTVMGADGVRYISVANNVYGVAVMNADGTAYEADPDQSLVLAGHDGIVGNTDDNMLAGRSAANNGGIAVGTVVLYDETAATVADGTTTITEDYYTIAGASDDFYVTAGIDKKLGTYDDVIRSKTGALGQYDIDGGTEGGDDEAEFIGWNYLGGDLSNMLVATEYVLDNVTFNPAYNADTNPNAYKYQDSLLAQKINAIGTALGMTATVNTVELDMGATQHKGNYVYVCTVTDADHVHNQTANCESMGYSTYYSDGTEAQANIAGTQFFALSLAEVIDAYGDSSTDAEILRDRRVQGAPKWLGEASKWQSGKNYNNVSYNDGEGNTISTTYYWLRSPGYTGARAANVNSNGNVFAYIYVTNANVGARPACYLNLASASAS